MGCGDWIVKECKGAGGNGCCRIYFRHGSGDGAATRQPETDMNDKAKSNSTITSRRVDGKIEFTVLGAGKFEFDPDKASAENRSRAMYHGWNQRIADGGALSRNPENGQPATPADKLARMQRLAEHYESGTTEWKLVPSADPEAGAGLVIRAMIRLGKATDVDHANARIAAASAKNECDRKAMVKKLAGAKDIAAAMAEIRAEDAAARATVEDSDELLAEMDEPAE